MPARPLQFDVSDEVLALGLRGSYFVLEDIVNREDNPALRSEIDQAVERIRQSPAVDSKSDPILKGFRDLHERVGCSNRKFVSSPENLLALVESSGRFPRVNVLVDAYNLVSVRTRLALGAHDIDRIDGNVHLRLTRGDERFVPLGGTAAKPIRHGEYGYMDDANDVICRLETRQVEKTKVDLATRHCFFIVQGNAATPSAFIAATADELITLLRRLCGGTVSMRWEAK